MGSKDSNKSKGSSAFFYNFAKESMEQNGYVVLPLEEITEISRSRRPDNHIVAIKYSQKTDSLLVVDGDYRTINVPTYNLPTIGLEGPIDFSEIRLLDLGLTVAFGKDSYCIDSHVLFAAEDPAFLAKPLKKSGGGG